MIAAKTARITTTSSLRGGTKRKFSELVGFVSPEKRGKLENALTVPGRNVARVRDEIITAIDYVGEMDVYDIETESHAFLTNNVVVHNCFIQGVEDDLVNEGGIMDLGSVKQAYSNSGAVRAQTSRRFAASGEKLSGGGTSSGLMSFLESWRSCCRRDQVGRHDATRSKDGLPRPRSSGHRRVHHWKVTRGAESLRPRHRLHHVREASQRDHEGGDMTSRCRSPRVSTLRSIPASRTRFARR